MSYVSPYLLLPRRDLPTACRQIRQAKGILVAPCGACALSDMCDSAEAKAVTLLRAPSKRGDAQLPVPAPRRKDAA